MAVASQEIPELSLGRLFDDSALLLDPSGESIACSSGGTQRVNTEPSPVLPKSPLELPADACQAIPVHIDLPLSSMRHHPFSRMRRLCAIEHSGGQVPDHAQVAAEPPDTEFKALGGGWG